MPPLSLNVWPLSLDAVIIHHSCRPSSLTLHFVFVNAFIDTKLPCSTLFSFVDIDGEQVALRLEEIVVLELPESLVSYGEELLEEQLKELKQKGEKERRRANVVLDFVRKKKDKEDDSGN